MDLVIKTLDGHETGKLKVSESIFDLVPREDILQRVVRWQLARRQQELINHKGALMYHEQEQRCLNKGNWTCSAFVCSCTTVSGWG